MTNCPSACSSGSVRYSALRCFFLGNNPGSVISTSPGCAVIVMPRTLAAEVRYSCFCTVVKPYTRCRIRQAICSARSAASVESSS